MNENSFDTSYVGNELAMMINGRKPMASFCRDIREDIDEFEGQNFGEYVAKGEIVRKIFYVKNGSSRVIYTVFVRPSELWRYFSFKALKKHDCLKWSREQEYLEGFLLGYHNVPVLNQ